MGTGMVGDLLSGQIDMIITSLTLTLKRSQEVQYLPPIGKESKVVDKGGKVGTGVSVYEASKSI